MRTSFRFAPRASALTLFGLLACSAPASLDPAFELRVAFENHERWIRPLWFGPAGPGAQEHLVVLQKGEIHAFTLDETGRASTPWLFLDVSADVTTRGNEQGLLGLAFHPRFQEHGRFFVYYSARERDVTRLSEFALTTRAPLIADPSSERVLLEIPQPYDNHNGGQIFFGPDGLLYVGVGDGGAAGDPQDQAQDLRSLLGKILRIDVDRAETPLPYAVPRDNPFVETANARPEIWSLGMRNPWRFSFDTPTGALWCGDVGQNKFEEVHVVTRGANCGWPLVEGVEPFRPDAKVRGPGELSPPVDVYPHSLGESVTGGFVYRGRDIPSLVGQYIFADYVSGRVFALPASDALPRARREIARLSGISSFGLDARDELYACAFDGHIWRFATPRRASD